MTGEVEAVPTDKASRIKARKASMTAGDPTSERKGTREGPGRSFRTPSAEVQQYTTWNMDMDMDMDMDMEDGIYTINAHYVYMHVICMSRTCACACACRVPYWPRRSDPPSPPLQIHFPTAQDNPPLPPLLPVINGGDSPTRIRKWTRPHLPLMPTHTSHSCCYPPPSPEQEIASLNKLMQHQISSLLIDKPTATLSNSSRIQEELWPQ